MAPLPTPIQAPRIRPVLIAVERQDKGADMKLSELAGKFELWMRRGGGYSPNTIDSYRFTYRQFGAYLTTIARVDDDLRNFTPEHVQGYADELLARGAKESTVTRRLSALSSLAEFGRKQPRGRGYLLNDDPTRRFDWPQAQDPETDYLHGDELRAIMDLPLEPYMAIARALLIETGLRATELCTAKIGDLQELGGERILRVIVKGRRSRLRKKSVPISDEVWAFLHAMIPAARRVDPEAPILVGAHGQAIDRTALKAMVYRMGREAGITRLRVHPHLFRHTANVLAMLANIDPEIRSSLLNHTDKRSLRRYEHIVPGMLHAARKAVNEARDRYVMARPSFGTESHNVPGGES